MEIWQKKWTELQHKPKRVFPSKHFLNTNSRDTQFQLVNVYWSFHFKHPSKHVFQIYCWSFSLFGDLIFLDMVFVFILALNCIFISFALNFPSEKKFAFLLRYPQEIMLGKKNPIHAKHLRKMLEKMYHSDFLSVEKEKKKLLPVNMLDPLICELIRSIFGTYVISLCPKLSSTPLLRFYDII